MTCLVVVSVVGVVKKIRRNWRIRKKQLYWELVGIKKKQQENRNKLQSVETKITRRDPPENPEALVMEKQNLLHTQWTLDEKKKNCDREILNREKLLDLT